MLPLFGNSIENEFQDYRFVLNEFDIHDNFSKNPEFQQFVEENKAFYKKNYSKAIQERFFIADELQTQLALNDASPILMYISFTESSLNSTLVSKSGAGGLWQFMPPTARDLSLTVDSSIDDRKNTKLATKAAVEYLTTMNKDFDKWYLTAMAYNCGPNKMKKAIAEAGTDDINVLLSENNNYLPDETKKYLKKILLYAMIGENHLFAEN
jgi:membrane-bound lytic murein transglycosylase D